jgi:hypothetical protein
MKTFAITITPRGLVDTVLITMPDGKTIRTSFAPGIKKSDPRIKQLIDQYNHEPPPPRAEKKRRGKG